MSFEHLRKLAERAAAAETNRLTIIIDVSTDGIAIIGKLFPLETNLTVPPAFEAVTMSVLWEQIEPGVDRLGLALDRVVALLTHKAGEEG